MFTLTHHLLGPRRPLHVTLLLLLLSAPHSQQHEDILHALPLTTLA